MHEQKNLMIFYLKYLAQMDLIYVAAPNLLSDTYIGAQKNTDQGIPNNHGRKLIDLGHSLDMRIVNGRIGDDTDGFICLEFGQSVIDYLVTSVNNISLIKSFSLSSKMVDSDHVALLFTISLKHDVNSSLEIGKTTTRFNHYKWDSGKKEYYIEGFYSEESRSDYDQFLCAVTDAPTVDELCDSFYNFLDRIVQRVSMKRPTKHKSTFPQNNWYNAECMLKKRLINDYASTHDLTQESHVTVYKTMLREYKTLTQHKKRNHFLVVRTDLENMVSNNPQHYWDFRRSIRNQILLIFILTILLSTSMTKHNHLHAHTLRTLKPKQQTTHSIIQSQTIF